ncbi:MAG: V-type ATP synthase subunit F [Clostridia bacterium]|nr:V-type ATP synthase subunit F [Clostridia bacterium]
MYKIGIIGERDSVMGFMAVGFAVHEAPDAASAGAILRALAKDESYAIIFITENYAEALEAEIAAYKDQPLPAIITIPGRSGSTGYGMAAVKSAVERAVGADILFKENK